MITPIYQTHSAVNRLSQDRGLHGSPKPKHDVFARFREEIPVYVRAISYFKTVYNIHSQWQNLDAPNFVSEIAVKQW